jgi:hypothetical protein
VSICLRCNGHWRTPTSRRRDGVSRAWAAGLEGRTLGTASVALLHPPHALSKCVNLAHSGIPFECRACKMKVERSSTVTLLGLPGKGATVV